MPQISLVPAELAGMVIETLLFGIYLATFFASVYLLFSRRFRGGHSPLSTLKSPMAIACFVLFVSIVAHWILDIIRLFDAFIYDKDGNPLAFYALLSDGKNVVKTFLYIFEASIGDSIMVYRLYHVWGRSIQPCVFPVLTTMLTFGAGIGISVQFSLLSPGVDVFTSTCGRWITTVFTATLCTNLYCSSLITYRLLKQHNTVRQYKDPNSGVHFPRVLQILVESAAIYSAATLVTFVSYLSGSNLQFPSLDSSSPVIGFVFCLIIVRVRFKNTGIEITTMHERSRPAFAMNPVAVNVNISQETETIQDRYSVQQKANRSGIRFEDGSDVNDGSNV
ncbi:uncharacterized protein STEHIDRAFT_151501 [Stereum hirsutum FP-91666 SS1]|uniref:uncharacterized protein n=1 Tax=Stereum hirsutum (strain FP-91666) TaxID=721885 RepID=UPI000440C1C3|nr:uncharacterized protein STEHIDRAFT_151501 [Stereum hirsutum FP-91666 SS1]EIM92158.1 hypothetical protein STEHIDRAFT_151501 [Stereum hirsutum FP-91666 SS1]